MSRPVAQGYLVAQFTRGWLIGVRGDVEGKVTAIPDERAQFNTSN